ncbi:MAG TPA: DUF1800 domain-containing protein, partial [Methylomirabilota bacterium]|nr:DUF1800 domain-containing protein [Methylomirabilota bacterium]
KEMGLGRWIERQLDPALIPDEAVQQMLAAYPTLGRTTAELWEEYPRPKPELLQRMASGQLSQKEMRELLPPEKRPYRIVAELQSAKVLRAVMSERQLQEVMVDFWFNHFNVFAQKGEVRWLLTSYERDAIRPHAMGRFRDLVNATARHPAMLFYLDNWMSTRADLVMPAGPQKGKKMGLNENYARELMELHTLGVDGGYTQQDVVEVARAFTGWTLERPARGGSFVFRPMAHDQGAKRVLGHVIPAGGGEMDGMKVIDILVRHPSTARFVSTKLVRRFVSDEPPAALVDRVAKTFRDTDGDVRAMLVTIFESAEFWSSDAYRAKIKTPIEVVASAARALHVQILPPGSSAFPEQDLTMTPRLNLAERPSLAERLAERGGLQAVGGGFILARQVATLGEPLYEMQPPTGYPDVAEAWVNTGALLNRMNFALALAHNRLPGARVDIGRVLAGVDRRNPDAVLDRLLTVALHGQATAETKAMLRAQLSSPEITRSTPDYRGPRNTDVEKLAALVLGSPEFQRR